MEKTPFIPSPDSWHFRLLSASREGADAKNVCDYAMSVAGLLSVTFTFFLLPLIAISAFVLDIASVADGGETAVKSIVYGVVSFLFLLITSTVMSGMWDERTAFGRFWCRVDGILIGGIFAVMDAIVFVVSIPFAPFRSLASAVCDRPVQMPTSRDR